jgi:hypothetical protein
VQARIACLSRDEEAKHREARKRLEERLWLYHDANIADFVETTEVEKREACAIARWPQYRPYPEG